MITITSGSVVAVDLRASKAGSDRHACGGLGRMLCCYVLTKTMYGMHLLQGKSEHTESE